MINMRERMMIFIPSGVLMMCCVIFMAFYFARFNSTVNAQILAEANAGGMEDINVYDIGCIQIYGVALASDKATATNYIT